jgi:hypothetical protein
LLFLWIVWAIIFAIGDAIAVAINIFHLFKVLPAHVKAVGRTISILVACEILRETAWGLEDISD